MSTPVFISPSVSCSLYLWLFSSISPMDGPPVLDKAPILLLEGKARGGSPGLYSTPTDVLG